ncbi:type II toxin-antitoxin system HipA family toxin [Rhodococcus triatomae]|uniref:Serine/threonine-protein kinase HipA n=1 Tax=Rhodococcus triatomae TaxID=300028 RepID=A0A1G8A283_9NOCA|nr:type II toxin-antitoxin system HipA family toxin [Rhodococcus triatomae]QNG17880.1 type II toxin-antitoxin system HipA family toxin [Rhodococcus triatomae]QNG22452.1 type II toxin-antitoxin system HipA family toxin [Rhodococcus triatomae]SDH14973.1 serine/threonine-protein kinase HipA [Rhodococcus triatomae]
MIQAAHTVRLGGRRVGRILQRGDVARFVFDDDYWDNPQRHVLGLWFEDNPRQSPQASLNLPRWFSNLLPEGPLREWIARDRGVPAQRELQLLLQIGHDLPGAVEVVAGDEHDVPVDAFDDLSARASEPPEGTSPWKFSLAGVGLKFSMLRRGDRLSIPARTELGDWIVKFPDAVHPEVPSNEFASMSLAREVGIECPRIELLHRDELPDVPDVMWPGQEERAYAVARFDRLADGGRVHIEDLAQVRNFYPVDKYSGSFETVGGLVYRNEDSASLREFVRRLTFNVLIGNGDAHLKNWSLIYRDGRRAQLSPAYDVVSTAGYYPSDRPDDLGLKFGGTKNQERIGRPQFDRMQRLLQVENADVLDVVDETIEGFLEAWAGASRDLFPETARAWIDRNVQSTATRLAGRGGA